MQMVNETKEQSSVIGSGLNAISSLGQKVLSLFRGGEKNPAEKFKIEEVLFFEDGAEVLNGFYIVDRWGAPYAGPYKREKDAKGQLTRLRKGYTPASRKL